jgi:hypothetical protein
MATGKTRDRGIESLAALGIGALLDTSHNLFSTLEDNTEDNDDGGSGGNGGSGGGSGSGKDKEQDEAPDVEGLVRIAVVASTGEENTEQPPSSSSSSSLAEGTLDIQNYEFSYDILSSVVSRMLSHANPFVRWIALAAVSNLFSIFEVRNRLLNTASLQGTWCTRIVVDRTLD